ARAIPMVLVPLVLAALVALAIAQQAYGELNLVSAFMFAVLLGLGIDFMVHILARYRDERVGHGLEQQAALERALTTTGMSTLTGALSTALAFAVLSVVDFRGISQFGVIASIGVLLTYVGAIFVMPAMAVLIEKVRPWKPRAGATIATTEPEPAPQQPGKRTGFRPWVTGVGLILVVIATGLGGYYGQHVEFEFDLNEIDAQPDPLTAEEMARKEEYRKAVGSASTTAPAVALTNNLDQSREAYRQLRALLDMSPKAFTAFTGLPSKRPTHAPSEDDPFLAHAGGLGSANLGLDEDEPPPAPTPKVADEDEDDEDEDEDEDDDDSMFEEDPRFVELAKKAQELNKLDPEVAKQLEAYGPERLQMMHDRIIEVASIHAFVPEHQQLKLEVIRDIRKWIDRKRGAFKGEAAKKLEEWEPYLKVENPVTIANLPEWVRVQFEDAQGELGKFVVIWTRGTKADYRESQYIYRGFISLETSTGEVPVAADYFVVTEVFDTLKADGPVVVGLALIALVVSVTVLFRSFTAPIIVLLTVVCALIWLAGIMAVQGWKFHFLNIIALPLLIGMGQDDAIHLLHRNMELKSIKGALRKTGGVLLFTTVTTQIGFGGMLVVNHPGLSSLGWVAVVGMMLCLIASVTVVPLLLSLGKPKA
ncbi:MAG: MMPL family transporter, partial [Nannocystaceae bacterium]